MNKQRLIKVIQNILQEHCDLTIELETINEDVYFTDLGLTSVNYLKLLALLEEQYDFEFDDNFIEIDGKDVFKVGTIVDYILSHT